MLKKGDINDEPQLSSRFVNTNVKISLENNKVYLYNVPSPNVELIDYDSNKFIFYSYDTRHDYFEELKEPMSFTTNVFIKAGVRSFYFPINFNAKWYSQDDDFEIVRED